MKRGETRRHLKLLKNGRWPVCTCWLGMGMECICHPAERCPIHGTGVATPTVYEGRTARGVEAGNRLVLAGQVTRGDLP